MKLYEKYLEEASEVKYSDLDMDTLKRIKEFGLEEDDVEQVFDGIHGKIITLRGKYGESTYRFKINELKKLRKARWVDIKSIGF